ncbi:Yos9p Ecym_7428 [Eremothecium cymbalariae DBVPG|uniref:Endoplasmic reticulum lectin n=1 Tax=Eremothecium cymbalariae (strain CBS 270.75 / DBVPG 7215 / KCTC 17166 / NRRL Y-17582) TaxID=931890 RepID=G8JWN6_ERECY|nr:hypothetical protein Ecym_7428 [Eremothecium cymbalariae DBVPG\
MFSGYRRRFFQDVSFAIIFMGLLSQAISDIPTILRGSKRYFMQAIDGNVFDRMFLLEGDNKSQYGTVEEFVDGSKYYVPDNTNGSQPISNIEEQEASIVEYASKIVNEELKTNKCLKSMGTWTYTICYDGRVRNVTQSFRWANFPDDILLGESVHDSEAEEPLKLLKDEDGYYLSEVLGSGAICSLTGEFRTTEIIYRCDGDVRTDRLKSAVEVGTCKYKLTATLGKLCELPLLSQNAFPNESNTIYFEKGDSGLLDVSSWLDHYEVDRVAGHFYLLSTYSKQLNNDALFVLLYTRFSMVEPNNASISQNILYKDALMAAMDILKSGLSRFSIFPKLVLIEKHELYLRVIDYQHNTLSILRLYQGSDNSLDMTTVDPEVVGNMEKGNFYNYCDEYLKQKKVSDYK